MGATCRRFDAGELMPTSPLSTVIGVLALGFVLRRRLVDEQSVTEALVTSSCGSYSLRLRLRIGVTRSGQGRPG